MQLTLLLRAAALATLALFGSCSSTPDGPTVEQRIQLHRENALRYYHMHELARAQDQIQRAIELDDEDPSLQLILGMTLQRRGGPRDVDRAERIFRELEKDDFRVTLGLGESLERKGSYYSDAARKVLSGERFTEDGDIEGRGAELKALAVSHWEEALSWYEKTLQLNESHLDALNGLQRTTALLGRREVSVEWSDRLLAEIAQNVEFYEKQIALPNITAAEERRWRDVLLVNTDTEVKTRLHASSLLYLLGRKDEAKVHLDRVIELEPDRPGPYSRRAQILMDVGEFEQAINSVDRFLALSPHPFEHKDVREAYRLRSECEVALTAQAARNAEHN